LFKLLLLSEIFLQRGDSSVERGTPFKWVKTANEVLDSMLRFGLCVQQVHGQ
jgi:hypothetical protein